MSESDWKGGMGAEEAFKKRIESGEARASSGAGVLSGGQSGEMSDDQRDEIITGVGQRYSAEMASKRADAELAQQEDVERRFKRQERERDQQTIMRYIADMGFDGVVAPAVIFNAAKRGLKDGGTMAQIPQMHKNEIDEFWAEIVITEKLWAGPERQEFPAPPDAAEQITAAKQAWEKKKSELTAV